MKKIISATIICLLFLAIADAQKISEKEAQQYLEKAWGYLKTSDSISFNNLWLADDSVWQKLHTPLSGEEPKGRFHRMIGLWMDEAVLGNSNIDHVTIGETNAKGTEIIAFFKSKVYGNIGLAFYVAFVNGKWTARGYPATLFSMENNKLQLTLLRRIYNPAY